MFFSFNCDVKTLNLFAICLFPKTNSIVRGGGGTMGGCDEFP